jgi:hypothetical protein
MSVDQMSVGQMFLGQIFISQMSVRQKSVGQMVFVQMSVGRKAWHRRQLYNNNKKQNRPEIRFQTLTLQSETFKSFILFILWSELKELF